MLDPIPNSDIQYSVGPTEFNPGSYRCLLAILREEEGDFSALVLNLPGAGSCGDTEAAAIANAREAVAGVLQSYIDSGEDIPWITDYKIPEGADLKWLVVNA